MSILKRISPGSAFKIGFVCHAILGLIAGAICTLLLMGALPLPPTAHPMFPGRSVGMLAIVICPIIYGVLGGIAALIGSFIYNLVSGWVGGLEVEISAMG